MIVLLSSFFVFAAEKKSQYISVKSAVIRLKPSQFSGSVATLKYGDEVVVLKKEKSWSNISSVDGKINGWIPDSSLSKKKLIVKTNSKTSANASELALAGKGFDKSFENTYAELYNLNLAEIDKIEINSCSEKDAIKFIREGELHEEEYDKGDE